MSEVVVSLQRSVGVNYQVPEKLHPNNGIHEEQHAH